MAPTLDLDRLDEPAGGPRVVIGWYDGWRELGVEFLMSNWSLERVP